MNLDFRYDSGTIEVKEMVEIVGNLCELEGVAKVMCDAMKKSKTSRSNRNVEKQDQQKLPR